MKTIRISDEVYAEIAKRGHFGETVDDVLRRTFAMTAEKAAVPSNGRRIFAERAMSPRVETKGDRTMFKVDFEGGATREWTLPEKHDRNAFRGVLGEVLRFAAHEGATEGQLKYIRKELNQAGYYIHGPRL